MSLVTDLKAIIATSIDMHVHIGPEVIPRRYTVQSLAASETGALAGAVLKNHFYPTAALAQSSPEFTEFGAVVLNWPVGGLNSEAIRASALISDNPIVVWLPTIHAAQFLDNSEYELAPEWLSGKAMALRRARDIRGITLFANNGLSDALSEAAQNVAKTVRDFGAVLATGHVSFDEAAAIASYALEIGVRAVIVTHPVYQRIAMPIAVQQDLAKRGCYMEVCYSMYSLDDIPVRKLADQIKAIGPKQTILSSDVGQLSSESPSEALVKFCQLLLQQDIPVKWLEMMLVTNPRQILGVK